MVLGLSLTVGLTAVDVKNGAQQPSTHLQASTNWGTLWGHWASTHWGSRGGTGSAALPFAPRGA